MTPEKGPYDGYSWQKYGQKNVKSNRFVRSYYRCSRPDCQVKKQVERSRDGVITDTVIFGDHDHLRTRLSQPVKVSFAVVAEEMKDMSCPVTSRGTTTVYNKTLFVQSLPELAW